MNPLLKRSDMAGDSKRITLLPCMNHHMPYITSLGSHRASQPFGW